MEEKPEQALSPASNQGEYSGNESVLRQLHDFRRLCHRHRRGLIT
jgi:hypothetical protein